MAVFREQECQQPAHCPGHVAGRGHPEDPVQEFPRCPGPSLHRHSLPTSGKVSPAEQNSGWSPGLACRPCCVGRTLLCPSQWPAGSRAAHGGAPSPPTRKGSQARLWRVLSPLVSASSPRLAGWSQQKRAEVLKWGATLPAPSGTYVGAWGRFRGSRRWVGGRGTNIRLVETKCP